MSLYFCDGCEDPIPANKARVHCKLCAEYDLCASCAVLGTINKGHMIGHEIVLYRKSGHRDWAQAGYPASSATVVPRSWSTLFDPNTYVALPGFVDIASAIFDQKDRWGVGYLTPEEYSSLLDMMDYPEQANIWKLAMKKSAGPEQEWQADNIMQQYYYNRKIEFILGHQYKGNVQPTTKPRAGSPLLTRKGFTDLWGMDVLEDPSFLRNKINTALQNSQPAVWRERGDVPVWAFPPAPVRFEVYTKTRNAATPSGGSTAPQTIDLIEPELAAHVWTPPAVLPSKQYGIPESRAAEMPRQTAPPPFGPPLGYTVPPQQVAEENSEPEELRRAREELRAMERNAERDLANLQARHELEFMRGLQQNHEAALQSMERSRQVMNTIGQDRDYIEERSWYR